MAVSTSTVPFVGCVTNIHGGAPFATRPEYGASSTTVLPALSSVQDPARLIDGGGVAGWAPRVGAAGAVAGVDDDGEVPPSEPSATATIFSRSRAYSVVPTSVGAVHDTVSSNLAREMISAPVGESFARARSPSSLRMIVLSPACSSDARWNPRTCQADSPVLMFNAVKNAGPKSPVVP